MKAISILLITLLSGNLLFAQHTKIVTAGSIEYEKSVNAYAVNRLMVSMMPRQLQTMYQTTLESYEKRSKQFITAHSTLTFNNNKLLFTPVAADNLTSRMAAYMAANSCKQMNTVYTDLSANTRTIQKDINDEQFLLKDSLSKIKWRITGATQDILGYTCREAHGVVLDSVYIVAFYTDKIWVGGGPESFSGLPGMILKLVLPHEHITWTATKITEEPPATAIEPPKQGKPINKQQLNGLLDNNSKRSSTGIYERKLFLL